MILKDLLKIVEEIRKDLAYTQRLEERWTKEQKRFPLIYESIVKQREFFQEVVDKALRAEVDESNLDEYVKNRPRLNVRRVKTVQVSPPGAMQAEKAPAPKTEMVAPAPEADAPAPEPAPAPAPEPAPAPAPAPQAEAPAPEPAPPEPEPSNEERAKTAVAPLDEIVEEAAREVGDKSDEADTRELSLEAPAGKKKAAKDAAGKKTKGAKADTRKKLQKLASEVLDEVKKSKSE